ncbi:MAG: GAF domain-containing SpoIIE family protein phosphatase [Desulfobacteraceae bacterium]|jgi:sigma-B regulation protein RsbU (phosphoserine phosphatase)|nr:GAF domain-containing SpoIIE family protein phosphatase [Desulfobacteraceae bacterium]
MNTNALEKELALLKKEQAALQAQFALFEKFISMTRSHDEPEVIRAILRETIEISIELTQAELGSLILLDPDGDIVDSILCRGELSPEIREELIKSVLNKGLAGWVFRHGKIGLVKDTEDDDRWIVFPDQPYTARSALALPIISGKRQLAILTLMHSEPGHFDEEIVRLMKNTANQIALVLENAYLFDNLNESYKSLGKAQQEIESYSKALDKELANCSRIQKSFLPRKIPDVSGWDIEEFFFPARRVSGDFYDVFELPGGYTGWVIGDVCDKGAGAALFMALTRSLIRIFSGQAQLSRSPIHTESQTVGGTPDSKSIRQYTQLEAIRTVALTNDYLSPNNDLCMFVTLFFAVLDPKNGKLLYINCGHETVFVIDANGIKERLVPTGPAVGLIAHATFEYKELQLQPGEILYAFTDGVTDARSTDGERFNRKRLVSLLSQPVATVFELMQRIGTNLFTHIGKAPQADDITMLALQRKIQ